MFDPSGGPYISVGLDMHYFGLEGVIEKISLAENKVVLTVKK